MAPQVHIIGASGRSGVALCRSLLADGVPFVPVVRNAAKWAATGIGVAARIADLADAGAPARSTCRRHADRQLRPRAPCPRRARCRTIGCALRLPGQHAQVHPLARRARQRRAGGRGAFLASGRSGVMLHPTMIYGAQGEDNVQRLAALLRRLPIVPLPGGGTALVQPIHQDDVTRAIRAALDVAWDGAAFAGDRRTGPPALRRLRARRRRRRGTAHAAHRRRPGRAADGAAPAFCGTFRSCRVSAPTKSAGCWKTRSSTCVPMIATLGIRADSAARKALHAPSHRRARNWSAPCRSSTASPSSIAR